MGNTVSLKHTVHTADRVLYFYDGEAEVKKGVVSVSLDRPEWVQRAWILGYQLDPKTDKPLALADILPST